MFNKDIGIDLGTANVLIYIKGQGIVLNEPSVVAIDSDTKRPLAVGSEAREMLGRTPGKVKAIKPMKDGVIADFEVTEIMLNEFIKKIKVKNLFSRPRILICCPTNITQVEKNAIKENFISNRVFPSIPILNDTAFASRTSLYPFQRFILFSFFPSKYFFSLL